MLIETIKDNPSFERPRDITMKTRSSPATILRPSHPLRCRRSSAAALALLLAAMIVTSSRALFAAAYVHVVYLSVDGLRESDLEDPNLAADLPNINALRETGVTYANAFTPAPTDSFPGALAEFTGASPRTTGIYYDFAHSNSLYAPGVTLDSGPGTTLNSTGDIDWNSRLLGGGDPTGTLDGFANDSSISPPLLTQRNVGGTLQPVYPHELLKVNTIFEVAHAAGLRTAYIDKHPSYEIVKGPSGTGLDDFYAPESDARVKIEPDGRLVDALTSTTGTSGLKKPSTSVALSNAYDDLRLTALLSEVDGKSSTGDPTPGNATPALFGMNFVALGNAQRLVTGGIDTNGTPLPDFHLALSHIDSSVGLVVNELKARGLFNNTLIVLTAKHGNSPRLGEATLLGSSTFLQPLNDAGIVVATAEQDTSVLLWLLDPAQAAAAKNALLQNPDPSIDTILAGKSELLAAGFGDPGTDDRTPDVIIKLKSGYVVSDSYKRAEHGGFSEDDSHIALVLASGNIPISLQGTEQTGDVSTTQIAVTSLEALGLDASLLQGAVIENTAPLPGTGIPVPEPSSSAFLALATVSFLLHRGSNYKVKI